MRNVATVLAAISAALVAVGALVASRVTAPVAPRQFPLTVRGVQRRGGRTFVQLDNTPQTRQPGFYSLLGTDGAIVIVGDVTEHGPLVEREVIGDEYLTAGSAVSWSGIQYTNPELAGLLYEPVPIRGNAGACPAWLMPGSGSVWAVHIHGMGSSRAGTLRGVQVADELGMPSLVVTHRNSVDGPLTGIGRSTLGFDEAADVAAALNHLVTKGATGFVLFGWSMGAQIALQLAPQTAWQSRICGIVADSPVLDWRATIASNCQRSGLPFWVGRLAEPWLQSTLLARLLGLSRALDLNDSDWVQKSPGVPVLVLQGLRDDSTPPSVVDSFAAAWPKDVTVEWFDAAHTTTWNSDPDRWRSTVTAWVTDVLETGRAVDKLR